NYDIPVGRGKRFGTDMSPWLNGVIGNWVFNMTGRVTTGTIIDIGSVKLVGMSLDDLQKAFKAYVDPATKIVYDMPQDIIQNAIKAFSTTGRSGAGYGALGAPTGRYLAPASDTACIQAFTVDCGRPFQQLLRGPVFTRFDMSLKKRIPFAHSKSIEVEF